MGLLRVWTEQAYVGYNGLRRTEEKGWRRLETTQVTIITSVSIFFTASQQNPLNTSLHSVVIEKYSSILNTDQWGKKFKTLGVFTVGRPTRKT